MDQLRAGPSGTGFREDGQKAPAFRQETETTERQEDPSVSRLKKRDGKANGHNGKVRRDYWLEQWEKEAILDFYHHNPLNGYRRLAFMMNDAEIVAVSPSTTYRVLKSAGTA